MTKIDVWVRRTARAVCGVVLTATLAACGGGGGGNAGTPVIGPGSGASGPSNAASAVAADLVVVLDKSTMSNSGADSITATVTSIDANRAAVNGVPVSFSVDANAVVTPAGTATDASGNLAATIRQGSDATVRPVTLTVTSGALSKTVTFNIVQDASPTKPQASDLTLTLSATNIDNSGSRSVVATATAVDAKRNALPGIPVQISVSDASAFVAASSVETNANGQVAGTINIGEDRSNRTITVTATSGTLVRTAAFQITGTRFTQASPVPAVITAGTAGTVQYMLTDVNSNPMPGVTITVAGSGLTTATGKTDLNGAYTYNYTAPNTPGANLAITALAGGVENTLNVPIPGGSTTVPVATLPNSPTLNLSADVVTVNTGSTSNQVTVNAFFRDSSNAPVPNVRVLFGVTGDNGTGKIGSGGNAVLSDASGTASTTYMPGAVSSPTNGVTIQACWKTGGPPSGEFKPTDTAGNCAAAGGILMTKTLTIVSNPVSISIGTDNTISIGASGLTYVKKYAVLVVDAAGNPKSDVQVTPSVDLGGYGKGDFFWNGEKWIKILIGTCPNEDLNRNGVIDTGEDVNVSGQLEPRKSDVAVALVGATKTDANGVAVLQLEYPQSVGSWVKFKITVTAAGVLSPPAYYPMAAPVMLPSQKTPMAAGYLDTYEWLPVLDAAVRAESEPPFHVSPYGSKSASCTEAK